MKCRAGFAVGFKKRGDESSEMCNVSNKRGELCVVFR